MNAINGGGIYHSPPQVSLIDVLFPGLSVVSSSAQHLLAGNLDGYTRLFCTLGVLVLFGRYLARYVWELVRSYFSSYASFYDGMSLTV
jgi:chaperone BCS1